MVESLKKTKKKGHNKGIFMFRKNEQIRISPIKVIDENGKLLGIMDTGKAIYLARQKGLDLVEIAPAQRPPICKMLDWSKFKYAQSKKKKHRKREEIKEMRFTAVTAVGDIKHKVKKIIEFLEKGKEVKMVVKTPHRISTSKSEDLLKRLIEEIEETEKIEVIQPIKREGFIVTAIIKSKK
jgi:translation initiation factor IF-3